MGVSRISGKEKDTHVMVCAFASIKRHFGSKISFLLFVFF